MLEVRNQLNEFKKFILRGNVVDLAVAVVIGAAFTGIVTSITDGIIKPLLALFGSSEVGKGFGWLIDPKNPATFMNFGNVITAAINFLTIAAVVFFLVIMPINKLTTFATRNKKTEDPATKKCPECLSEIPKDARRCKFCTAELTAKDTPASLKALKAK